MKLVKRLTMLIFTLWLIVSPVIGATAARVPPLDTTDVMDDLQGLKIGDVAFNADTYLSRTDGAPELLGMYEYGFSSDLYALYFYIYVPDQYFGDNGNGYDTEIRGFYGDINVFKDTKDNQPISMYVCLTIIDTSDDGHFFKCKVDPEYDLSVLSNHFTGASSRIYLPELYMDGDDIPQTADPYGRYDPIYFYVPLTGIKYFTYTTTGAAMIESSEIINLTVKPSMYKFDTHPNGDYWHQMLYTAYFTIPAKYVDDFDYLCGIRASWYEAQTDPVVVTDNDDLLSVLDTMASDDNLDDKLFTGQINHDYGAIVSNYLVSYSNGMPSMATGDFGINLIGLNGTIRENLFYYDAPLGGWSVGCYLDYYALRSLGHAFKVDDLSDDYYISTFGDLYDTDGDGYGDVRASLSATVDKGAIFGQQTHDFTMEDILNIDNRWDGFWDRLFDVSAWGTNLKDIEDTVKPFYYLQDKDMAGCTADHDKMNHGLYIGAEYWSDFYETYINAKQNGDQVVLFRFAVRDYYSAPAQYIDGDTYTFQSSAGMCALSYGTCFKDFDIITLSFSKESCVYVFNVDADPITFLPGVYDPDEPGGGGGDDWLVKLFAAIELLFKVIVGLFAIIVIVTVVKWVIDLFARRRR